MAAPFRGIRSRNSIEFTRLTASPSRFRAGANGKRFKWAWMSTDWRNVIHGLTGSLKRYVVVKLYHARYYIAIKSIAFRVKIGSGSFYLYEQALIVIYLYDIPYTFKNHPIGQDFRVIPRIMNHMDPCYCTSYKNRHNSVEILDFLEKM